jgi:glycosyltransferase involved in cell wall biosynthesis
MLAYNATKTLERTYHHIPQSFASRIILADDVSKDNTVAIARQLGLDVLIHRQNLGNGGNQKTCYDAELAVGADAVVMLHPDYQYNATRIPALVEPILEGEKDLMLGSLLSGRSPRGRHADLGIRLQPLSHDRREPCLRAAPVRMSYQASNALWFSINWLIVGAALALVASSSVSRRTLRIPGGRL